MVDRFLFRSKSVYRIYCQHVYSLSTCILMIGTCQVFISVCRTQTDGLFYLLFRPGFPISKFTPTLHPWLRPLLWVAVDSAIVSAVSSFDCSHGNKLSFYPLMGEQAPSLCDMSVLSFPVLWESLHGTHTATTRGQHQPLWPITSTGWLPRKLSDLRINLALLSRSANVFVSNQLKKTLDYHIKCYQHSNKSPLQIGADLIQLQRKISLFLFTFSLLPLSLATGNYDIYKMCII